MDNTVFVLTKARPFGEEVYVDVFTSAKAAESHLRKNISPYIKKDGDGFTDRDAAGNITLYFVHKEAVKS